MVASNQMANIHTPLTLLDDYAVCEALSEHYQASKVKASVTVKHRFWTFSCGVDVQMPAEVVTYMVYDKGQGAVGYTPLGTSVVQANNGVLLMSPDNDGHTYELTAVPSANRPTGTVITTDNAQTYAGNLLVPVIQKRHFLASRNYYVLVNNKFCEIMLEEADACCPACKAVLRLPVTSPYGTIEVNTMNE